MQRRANKLNTRFIVTLALILFWMVGSASANLGEDLEKKYAAILGDYSFDLTDHGFGVIKVTFYVEADSLLAITEVSSDPGQMEPVEGKDFEFTIEDPEEGTYSIKFSKDESGKYTKCHILNESMGMDVTGEKVI
jgi:hypothetical protein